MVSKTDLLSPWTGDLLHYLELRYMLNVHLIRAKTNAELLTGTTGYDGHDDLLKVSISSNFTDSSALTGVEVAHFS